MNRRTFSSILVAAVAVSTAKASVQPSSLAFRVRSGQILLDDVQIAGSLGTAVFDTGAAFNSVASTLAGTYNLSGGRRQRLNTFQGQMFATLYPSVPFAVQGIQFQSSRLLVLPDGVDWNHGRIVAASAFEEYAIDFARSQIQLSGPFMQGEGAAGRYSRAMHSLKVGRARATHLLIDTGSYESKITPSTLARLQDEGERVEKIVWETTENGTAPALVRFDTLSSGETALRRPVFEISDNAAIGRSRHQGILGVENMEPYNWTFNRSTKPLDFAANGALMRVVFTPGMTTIHDAESARITKIILDGPAMRAGLQLGDRLIALNETPVGTENIDHYMDLVTSRSPRILAFDVERGGRRFKAAFQSEEII